jgi:hypothetical protein
MVSQAKAMSVPVPAANAQLGSFEKRALAMLGAIFGSMERTSGGDPNLSFSDEQAKSLQQ